MLLLYNNNEGKVFVTENRVILEKEISLLKRRILQLEVHKNVSTLPNELQQDER